MIRKQRNEIIIMIVIIAITVGAVFLIPRWKENEREEVRDTVKNYMSCISSGDYDKMYEMVTEDSLGDRTKQEYISRNQNIYSGMHVQNLEISNITVERVDSGQYKVKYRTTFDTYAGELDFTNEMQIVEESSEFKIVWDDSLILPGLDAESKVKVRHLKAKRGEILDRNGNLLAGEGTADEVGIVPGRLENKTSTLKQLSELLDMSESTIEAKLSENWVTDDSFVPITTIEGLSDEEEEEDTENQELHEALLSISGIQINETECRVYPGKESTAHLIGYVQDIDAEELKEHRGEGYNETSVIGKSGLEATYESKLRAQDGYEIYIEDADGDNIKTLAKIKKKDGDSIRLSIDLRLQKLLYAEFSEDTGCSVALHPYTGEILALVSTPSYDTNEFVRGISSSRWSELNADEDQPMLNRYKQRWVPGSTFKPIVASIGLDTESFGAWDDFGYEGTSWQKDSTWGSYYVTTLHENSPVNLYNSMVCSDNIYFAKAGIKIGSEKMEEYLEKLGFGEEIPVGLALSKSQYSNEEHIETEVQLADTGYGQGQLLVNPIHLASLYTAFTNQGNILKPTIEYDRDGVGENWFSEAFSVDTVSNVLNSMIGVVNDSSGTGYAARSYNYTLAGKTGTAELKSEKGDSEGQEIGWFAIFTTEKDMEKPILLLSMVENVNGKGGSSYVVEKDKEVLNNYIGY